MVSIIQSLIQAFCVLFWESKSTEQIFYLLEGIFTPEQHLRFLEFYKKLCTLGLEQENGHSDNQVQLQTLEQEKKYILVRKNCAYNLPVSETLFYFNIPFYLMYRTVHSLSHH